MSRPDRIAQRIKFEVSEIIRKEVDDPRIGFVTITNVEVSKDLSSSKIHFSVLGEEKAKKESMKGLQSAKKFIRGRLGEKLKTRIVPNIIFDYDDSIEKASNLFDLMKNLK